MCIVRPIYVRDGKYVKKKCGCKGATTHTNVLVDFLHFVIVLVVCVALMHVHCVIIDNDTRQSWGQTYSTSFDLSFIFVCIFIYDISIWHLQVHLLSHPYS